MPSFDGRRFRSTRASRIFTMRVAAAISAVSATTLRAIAHAGAHRRNRDETSEGSASSRAFGKTTPARTLERRMPDDRNQPIVPIWKRMGRRESARFICTWLSGHALRRAKACRARSRDVARRPFFCRSQFVRIRPREWIDWVPVSTVSVADTDRTHLRSCGSDRESGSGGVGMTKRGVESAQSLPTYAV